MGCSKLFFLVILSLYKLHECRSEDTRLRIEPKEDIVRKNTKVGLPSFRFASYYGDHMVLHQAPKKSTVWGYASTADIGKDVNVVLYSEDGTHKSVCKTEVERGRVDGETVWSVQLNPRPAGGPYNLTVSVQTATLVLSDVLFGDVWLCGGQSNMAFTVPMMNQDEYTLEYTNSEKYQNVRIFTAGLNQSTVPLYDLESVMEKWTRPSPSALGKGQKSFTYFSAVCWIFGRRLYETLGYPIGLLESDWGGTPDEAWMSRDALKQCGLDNVQTPVNRIPKPPNMSDEEYQRCCGGLAHNTVLWNAMIHPLLNLTISGAVWYQGEADRLRSNYECTFPAMISDWRSKFHTGSKGQTDAVFPFGFVQLAGWNPPAPGTTTKGFPSLRWQQTAKYGFVPNEKMPNTFMAIAMDLPDFRSRYGSIHPRDKETVGFRLAVAGLAQAYKLKTKFQGPMITSIKTGSKSMQIEYDLGKTAISVRSTWGFELCCPSKELNNSCDYNIYGTPWQEASIVSHNLATITMSTVNCTNQVLALRYAWRESPCEYKMCAVYSVDNELPAPPVFIAKSQLHQEDSSGNLFRVIW